MRITKKTKEAEKYVDEYISEHGVPPTYKEVMNYLNLKSTSVAYHRCRTFRDKMVISVKKYTEKELVSFGNYLLSKERREKLLDERNLNQVNHADLENFIQKNGGIDSLLGKNEKQ